jgi:hypothetical protein
MIYTERYILKKEIPIVKARVQRTQTKMAILTPD